MFLLFGCVICPDTYSPYLCACLRVVLSRFFCREICMFWKNTVSLQRRSGKTSPGGVKTPCPGRLAERTGGLRVFLNNYNHLHKR